MKLLVKKGKTSKRIVFAVRDSSSTTGAFKTGLTSASFAISYTREDDGNANATTVSLSGGTRGTWSSGGIVEKDATNAKGDYEFGVPNAALASGSEWVTITVQDAGSNNVAPLKIEIQLVDFDPHDAVRLGLTALPSAAVGSGANSFNFSASGWIKGDLQTWIGTAPLALSSQQVQAVVPDTQKVDVNTIKTQAVTCTAGVTVNPNVGTTQPVNFHGTGATAYVKTDVVEVLDVAASTGPVDANVVNVIGTALTEGAAGRLAGGVVKFFNVAAPQATMDHMILVDTVTTYTGNTPQTGDTYALANGASGFAAIKTDTGNLVARITATLFSGITSLGKWLGLLAGKTADASTLAEVNATTAGATFNNTTDSLEALRDRGDAAWITATSVTVSDKTGFKLAGDGLDALSAIAPDAVATTFREKLMQLWQRFFGKAEHNATAGTIKTFKPSDASQVATTQTATEVGSVETQGVAT